MYNIEASHSTVHILLVFLKQYSRVQLKSVPETNFGVMMDSVCTRTEDATASPTVLMEVTRTIVQQQQQQLLQVLSVCLPLLMSGNDSKRIACKN